MTAPQPPALPNGETFIDEDGQITVGHLNPVGVVAIANDEHNALPCSGAGEARAWQTCCAGSTPPSIWRSGKASTPARSTRRPTPLVRPSARSRKG